MRRFQAQFRMSWAGHRSNAVHAMSIKKKSFPYFFPGLYVSPFRRFFRRSRLRLRRSKIFLERSERELKAKVDLREVEPGIVCCCCCCCCSQCRPLGPVSRKPRNVFGPVKPFLDHLYLKT